MTSLLDPYKTLLGAEIVDQLYQMANLLKNVKIVHVNSTKEGGGVAEILSKMVPLMQSLGLQTQWEIIKGNQEFFECTKKFHNLIQGQKDLPPSPTLLKNYEQINAENANTLRGILEEADVVFIHDPQPVALIDHFPKRKGKWIWRCHIDASSPSRQVWKYLRRFIDKYDGSIFSLEDFVRPLPHPIFLMAPSIDPFSDKNCELDPDEIRATLEKFHIDPERPLCVQISRFDGFKDPVGVIQAYLLAKKYIPRLQLVLAGGGASDDPEGAAVFAAVQVAANADPDIHVLLLPSDAHRTINALQRAATVVMQKSLKEGFGLTVTEALWKSKPVIAGNTGGIRLQVLHHHTGYLVNSPEGAALRLRQLLQDSELALELGAKGKRMVKENFLITRNLREYLTIMAISLFPQGDRIVLNHRKA